MPGTAASIARANSPLVAGRPLAHCGEPMHAGDVDILPGPGAAVPVEEALS